MSLPNSDTHIPMKKEAYPRCCQSTPQSARDVAAVAMNLLGYYRRCEDHCRSASNANRFAANRRAVTRMIGTMSRLLAVQSLTVELRTAAGTLKPVNDVSFRIEPGQALGIV